MIQTPLIHTPTLRVHATAESACDHLFRLTGKSHAPEQPFVEQMLIDNGFRWPYQPPTVGLYQMTGPAVQDGDHWTLEVLPWSQEQIVATLVNAVQDHLDTTAQTRYYDGILSLCTYVTSTDPTFASEGQAGVEWRDACWRRCYEVLAECQAGTRQIPTPEELVALLPALVW